MRRVLAGISAGRVQQEIQRLNKLDLVIGSEERDQDFYREMKSQV